MLPIGAGITRRSIAAGIRGDRVDPVTRRLLSVPGLSCYLDCGRSELYARHGLGDPRVGFMAARNSSAPGVHIALDGRIITETRSDVPLTVGGYWDTTGFHKFHRPGWWVGKAATNLLKDSDFSRDTDSDGVSDNWGLVTISGVTPSRSSTDLPGGANGRSYSQTLTFDETFGANFYQASQSVALTKGDLVTVSGFIKHDNASMSGNGLSSPVVEFYAPGVVPTLSINWANLLAQPSGEWRYFEILTTATGTGNASLRLARVASADYDVTGSVSFAYLQIEKSPYATLHVPTTTAALTRPKDICLTLNAGNRNAAEETIIIVATPWGDFANDGIARLLMSSSVKDRRIEKYSTHPVPQFKPNSSDNGDCAAYASGADINGFGTYTFAAVCKHSSPYAQLYIDGVSVAGDSSDDYVNPAWGDFTYLGSSAAGTGQLNGVIHAVVVFNRALSAAEVAYVTNLLTGAT